MGWWSTDIMGGDTPLDFEDTFFDICGVEKFPEIGKANELTKEDFAAHLNEIVDFLDADKWGESNIGYQVLAVGMLRAGAFISGDLQDFMMQACENDEWAKENEERAVATQGLFNALSQYDNETPIIIKSRGLFEVMAQKLGGKDE
jgi:hypothetical protein